MQVFKFGGASVNSVERIKKLADILKLYPGQKILVVVSAMGKTTNALENVTNVFFNNNKEEALLLFEKVKQEHLEMAKSLLATGYKTCEEQLNSFFTEVEWLLHDKPVRNYDYYYDQVVCTGELLSTSIVSAFLREAGINNKWVDVRDIIRTDDNFRDANIDWNFTETNVKKRILPFFDQFDIVLTQGFIGATDENESTTLGREGSDYTAAVFASMLNAESQTIWKDVPAVMNADPKQYPDATPIPELSYTEVIEMAYYGAQVIHPKTIKPLQNKNIPLHVKCFSDPSLPGTIIRNNTLKQLPPIIVLKEKQVMMELSSKDFSFVGEKPVSQLYQLFAEERVKPNLTQNGAISIVCVLDEHPEKIDRLAISASGIFDVQVRKDLRLVTIRHYNQDLVQKFSEGKKVLLRQQTPETIQMLMAN